MDGVVCGEDGVYRCWWCVGDQDYRDYHDFEWGRPERDDRLLFEKLSLESFQSGLSWLTILRKREGFRRAFLDFDFHRVADFGPQDVERLLLDPSIVRHRQKIEATINNARRAVELLTQERTLADFFWRYADTTTERARPLKREMIVSRTESSERLSQDLKKRGWKFVGPTTAYSFLQAAGLVNDHLEGCSSLGSEKTSSA